MLVLVTTALSCPSGDVDVSFGTAAGGTELTGTLDEDSLIASVQPLSRRV